MFRVNKTQVSIFVIIGVIIVIVVAFLFLNGKYEIWQSHDTKIKNQISGIVEDCIYDSASRGAFLLGYQGGYIYIPKYITDNPFAYTDFGLKIPNWDVQRGNIPTIKSMEDELNMFIINESISCIANNIETLKDAFDIRPEGNLVVDTRINNHNIVIESKYLINFNEKNSEEDFTISNYLVELDGLKLGDMYSLAAQIYNLEYQDYIFEDLVIEQIRSADDYSSRNSMPTEGMSLSCGVKYWTLPRLKENLANLNNNNFKYLQFVGTYSKQSLFDATFNNEILPSEYKQYYDSFYRFSLPETKESYKNYDVEVVMPSVEVTGKEGFFKSYPYRRFEVTPSSGQVVKSMQMEVDAGLTIPIPCIQLYHHLYDLDYDLIIKLTDYSEDGKRYLFQFPLRIKIENTEPKETDISLIQTEPNTFNSNSYCDEEMYKYPLLVTAKDNRDNELSDVNISYKCINIECDMGVTKKPLNILGNPEPELQTNFPFCIGGKVIGEKTGYYPAEYRVDTDDSLLRRETFEGDNFVELVLIPKKDFKVSAETFLVINKEDLTGTRILDESQGTIYVSIKNDEYEFESIAVWPNEEGFLDKIEFLDEDDLAYNLSIYYMDGNSNLKGIFTLENWVPNIHAGNTVQFTIPGTKNEITEDDYLSFFEYVQEKVMDQYYQPRFY